MRRIPTVAGLLLIFVGLLLVACYNLPVANESWIVAAENTDRWSITCNFESGDNMTLIIAWTAMTYGEDLGELPANITITANSQDTTEFQVFFLQGTDTPPGQEEVQVYVSRIQLLSNNGDSLSVGDPPQQIGGIVNQAGTYEARVHPPDPDYFPWAGPPENPNPPRALQFLKLVVTESYPYRTALPIGAATGFVGAVVSVWGARTSKNEIRLRKKRKMKK